MPAVSGCGIVNLAGLVYHDRHLWGSVIIEVTRYENK
jgi:hypothetical protein